MPVKDRFDIRAAGCAIEVLAPGSAHTTGDLKQQFSNGSDVNAALFAAYVTGPAVTNAWLFR